MKHETLGECFTLHRTFEDQRTPKASPGLKRGFLAGWLLLVPQILRVTWVYLSRELVGVKCRWRCGGRAGPREDSPVLTPHVQACVRACWGWGVEWFVFSTKDSTPHAGAKDGDGPPIFQSLLGGSGVKNLPANAEDAGSIPGLGRYP